MRNKMTNWKMIESNGTFFMCCDEYQVQYECKQCGTESYCVFCEGFDSDESHECD
jgi:hypothetical protein